MSRIDELIAEYCPDGVAFEPLGNLVERGTNIRWSHDSDEEFRYIDLSSVDRVTHAISETETITRDTAPSRAQQVVREGDVIFGTTRPMLKRYCIIPAEYDGQIASTGYCVLRPVRDRLLTNFLFHVIGTVRFYEFVEANERGASYPAIPDTVVKKFRIPVPPLQVQREIVRILDQFTQLEAELDAELIARKLQRLAFARTLPGAANMEDLSSSVVEHIRLGDVASQYVEPMRVQADTTYTNLGVKWYGEGVLAREPRLGSVIKATILYGVKPGHLIYNRMFVTEGSFAVVPPELADGVVSNEFPVYELDSSRILPEWLLLYLQDEYTLKRIAAETTGVERGSMKSRRRWKEEQFEAFKMALPSISVQREMVRVVGTIGALESALRDELTARRKQHEHYRDRLLTFEEAVG